MGIWEYGNMGIWEYGNMGMTEMLLGILMRIWLFYIKYEVLCRVGKFGRTWPTCSNRGSSEGG